jgi:hypothetical protein
MERGGIVGLGRHTGVRVWKFYFPANLLQSLRKEIPVRTRPAPQRLTPPSLFKPGRTTPPPPSPISILYLKILRRRREGRKQWSGSVPFWYRSGSGSGSGSCDTNKNYFFYSFFAYYFLKISFFKDKKS